MDRLPAFRIVPIPAVEGQYWLIVNWDPGSGDFRGYSPDLVGVNEGEYGATCTSWYEAYNKAMAAIERIGSMYHRKALKRALTPIPLARLSASILEWETELCEKGIGVSFAMHYLNSDPNSGPNASVNERDGTFQGIHDTR